MSAHEEARAFLAPNPGVMSTLHIYVSHALRMIQEYDDLKTMLDALTEAVPIVTDGRFDAESAIEHLAMVREMERLDADL